VHEVARAYDVLSGMWDGQSQRSTLQFYIGRCRFNVLNASGSGCCLAPRLNAYLPKRTIDAAIGKAVQRLQYSRATKEQTSVDMH